MACVVQSGMWLDRLIRPGRSCSSHLLRSIMPGCREQEQEQGVGGAKSSRQAKTSTFSPDNGRSRGVVSQQIFFWPPSLNQNVNCSRCFPRSERISCPRPSPLTQSQSQSSETSWRSAATCPVVWWQGASFHKNSMIGAPGAPCWSCVGAAFSQGLRRRSQGELQNRQKLPCLGPLCPSIQRPLLDMHLELPSSMCLI